MLLKSAMLGWRRHYKSYNKTKSYSDHFQEQQNIVEIEHLRANSRSRAQTQEFANLTAELLAGRRGLEILDGRDADGR